MQGVLIKNNNNRIFTIKQLYYHIKKRISLLQSTESTGSWPCTVSLALISI